MSNQKYPTVIPYIILKDALKFIDFAEKVFDAKLTEKIMSDENIVQHAQMLIRESMIMIAEATEN